MVPVFAGKGIIPWLRSGAVLVLINPWRRVVTGMNELVAPLKLIAGIDQMLAIGKAFLTSWNGRGSADCP